MSPEAQQRIMEFTSEVIARESALALAAVQPGNGVEIAGSLISVDPTKVPSTKTRKITALRAGQILVADRVEVVPFVVPTRTPWVPGSPTGWIEPVIGTRSVFGRNRPTLPKLPLGGAVYLVGRYDVTESWAVSDGSPYIARAGVLVGAEVVQVPLGDPPPYTPWESKVSIDYLGSFAEESDYPKEGTAYSSILLGVYTRDGATVAFGGNDRVKNFEDPMGDLDGPHYVPAPEAFPVEIEYTFLPPPPPAP